MKPIVYTLVVSLFFSQIGCAANEQPIIVETQVEEHIVSGIVVNENTGEVMADVKVRIGDVVTETDETGFYSATGQFTGEVKAVFAYKGFTSHIETLNFIGVNRVKDVSLKPIAEKTPMPSSTPEPLPEASPKPVEESNESEGLVSPTGNIGKFEPDIENSLGVTKVELAGGTVEDGIQLSAQILSDSREAFVPWLGDYHLAFTIYGKLNGQDEIISQGNVRFTSETKIFTTEIDHFESEVRESKVTDFRVSYTLILPTTEEHIIVKYQPIKIAT